MEYKFYFDLEGNSAFKNASGIYLGNSGFSLGDKLYYDNSNLVINGHITATSGSLTSCAIKDSCYFGSEATDGKAIKIFCPSSTNSAYLMKGTGNNRVGFGGDDAAIWAGSQHSNSTAPFRVMYNGDVTVQSLFVKDGLYLYSDAIQKRMVLQLYSGDGSTTIVDLGNSSSYVDIHNTDIWIGGGEANINTSSINLNGKVYADTIVLPNNIAYKCCDSSNIEHNVAYVSPSNFAYYAWTDCACVILQGEKVKLKTANGVEVTSDRRLKHDISPISQNYLDAFMDLEVVKFRYNKNSVQTNVGLIYQDAKAVMEKYGIMDFAGIIDPDMTSEDESFHFGNVIYDQFQNIHIAVTQDHEKQINQLKAEIDELKTELKKLKQSKALA